DRPAGRRDRGRRVRPPAHPGRHARGRRLRRRADPRPLPGARPARPRLLGSGGAAGRVRDLPAAIGLLRPHFSPEGNLPGGGPRPDKVIAGMPPQCSFVRGSPTGVCCTMQRTTLRALAGLSLLALTALAAPARALLIAPNPVPMRVANADAVVVGKVV